MSNSAINYVDEHAEADLPSGMFFVLVRLADRGTSHSGEDWTCFPSVDDLVRQTRLSRSAVERHLQGLVARGWISRKRRVRPDGRLSFYDYWIHREPNTRAALKAARAAIVAAGEKLAETRDDLDHPAASPCCNSPHGPCGELDETMRRFGAEPCGKSPHQEPTVEPKYNPHSGRAREPGDEGWQEALAAWPDSGRKRTVIPAMRAQWALWAGEAGAGRLLAALKAAAADPVLGGGDYGFPGLHTFLADERWRAFLPAGRSGGAEGGDGGEAAGPRFGGPAAIREAVAAAGDAAVLGCLDRAAWDAAGRRVTAATGWAFDRLGELERRAGIFKQHDATLAGPARGDGSGG